MVSAESSRGTYAQETVQELDRLQRLVMLRLAPFLSAGALVEQLQELKELGIERTKTAALCQSKATATHFETLVRLAMAMLLRLAVSAD